MLLSSTALVITPDGRASVKPSTRKIQANSISFQRWIGANSYSAASCTKTKAGAEFVWLFVPLPLI